MEPKPKEVSEKEYKIFENSEEGLISKTGDSAKTSVQIPAEISKKRVVVDGVQGRAVRGPFGAF